MRIRVVTLIGREAETGVVERALAAARDGQGSAIFLSGESGVGKSRLAAAGAGLGYAAGMALLRGRGTALGPSVPYRPLAEALMSMVRAGDSPEVAELGPYRPVLARLVPDWGPPSTLEDGGSLVVLAEAVLRLLALAGRDRGCLLVLDDLQDADAETLAVVEYLVDNLARQPVVLLAAVRPEPSPAWDLARSVAQRNAGTLLRLGPLDRDQVRRLVAGCLEAATGDMPDAVPTKLWEDSGGNPLLVEELLAEMLAAGLLVRDAGGWRVSGQLRTGVPATLVRTVARQIERLGQAGRDVLSTASVLGARFPLPVVQAVTGLADRDLLGQLHAEPAAHLLAPDEQTPGWYAFRHPMIVDSLLAQQTPVERARIARRAAEAIEALHPGLPGEWCQASAALWRACGEPGRAGRLFAEAGRRALAQGAVNSAITLLDRSLDLLDGQGGDPKARAEAFATLLHALAEAGQVERALACAAEFGRVAAVLDRGARAHLHTRLAWAAAVAGRTMDGMRQVATARNLLGPDASAEDAAPIDVVAAHLALDVPGPDQITTADALARRAARVAETVPLPVVACQAWQLLGALTRPRDPDEATACLHRALVIAERHDLPIWRIHALIRLGNDDALRDASLDRLEQARQEATRVGAVTARYQAESSLALQAVLRGDFETAGGLIDQVLTSTTRLKLMETTQYILLVRAVLAAHRGRRREMDDALLEFRRWEGDQAQHAPRVYGLARTWCALLEENRPRAMKDIRRAMTAEDSNPTIFQLNGRYGLHLLLRVLAGEARWPEYEEVARAPASRLRWDRQFALLAAATLAGRAGRRAEAVELFEQATSAAEPYRTGRHLGLRLVAEAALVDGWGEPVEWLRAAEEHFHGADVPAVSSACRALLRRAGAPVAQRRTGVATIPAVLRGAGVTVREYEIFRLLTGRLGNREIAERLHLSPRTVEKHVASLLAKTGRPNRIALSEYGTRLLTEAG